MKSTLKKKSILLVYDDHCFVAQGNIKILSNNYNINSYCSILYKNNLTPNLKKNIKFFKYHEGFLYIFLIFKSFKYDYVFITTGPQNYRSTTGILYLLFYLIFIFFHGKKTFMGIRDNKKYFRGINTNIFNKIQNFIRNKSISRIKLIFFETRTLMKSFKKKFDKKNLNCFVNYPRRFPKNVNKKYKSDINILKIGILGMLVDKKKDYNLLINAIKKLSTRQKKKIKLIILGTVGTVNIDKQNYIIKKLKKEVKIEYRIGYIPQTKFDEISSSCHFLISPLKYGYGGFHKGTGSFFDAIAVKKHLIIPFHADPHFEFKNFCSYYRDKNSLHLILKKFINHKFRPLSDDIFKLYNNKEISNELKNISLE